MCLILSKSRINFFLITFEVAQEMMKNNAYSKNEKCRMLVIPTIPKEKSFYRFLAVIFHRISNICEIKIKNTSAQSTSSSVLMRKITFVDLPSKQDILFKKMYPSVRRSVLIYPSCIDVRISYNANKMFLFTVDLSGTLCAVWVRTVWRIELWIEFARFKGFANLSRFNFLFEFSIHEANSRN